jgi:hypothetical protein
MFCIQNDEGYFWNSKQKEVIDRNDATVIAYEKDAAAMAKTLTKLDGGTWTYSEVDFGIDA